MAFSAVYLLGNLFGITTPMSMLELVHPSQPLFRRLLTEAPGTYHHAVVWPTWPSGQPRKSERIRSSAELAPTTTTSASWPILCLHRESGQRQSIHDQLDSFASARLIMSHVSDGLELARRHGVPRRVRDMIAEHHGTTMAQYFYHEPARTPDSRWTRPDFATMAPAPVARGRHHDAIRRLRGRRPGE